MIITIEPSKGEDFDLVVYKDVSEFALTATSMRGKVLPNPINHTHGDPFVLIGKLEELKERMRAKVNG